MQKNYSHHEYLTQDFWLLIQRTVIKQDQNYVLVKIL